MAMVSVLAEAITAKKTAGDSAAQAQRETLLGIARDWTLFHDASQQSYAALQRFDGPRETWPVAAMEPLLVEAYYRTCGRAPGTQALTETLGTLEARARFDGPQRPVYRRVGQSDGVIYLDLCNADWQCVRISPDGWKVGTFNSVHFVREPGMLPLPTPERGGSLDPLRSLLPGLDDDSWRLLVGFLAMVFQPVGPYPILVFQGPAGSGKSTCARMVRALTDPHAVPLAALPRDERDLMIAASNSWLQGFDNVSDLKDQLSDAFCRLVTGAGYRTRKLHTDSTEILFNVQRPLLLNGIGRFIWREDLLSRSLVIELSEVSPELRRSEADIWADFRTAQPRILGALLDATVQALRERPGVKLSESPRLHDFARWGTAIERALKWPDGSFMQAYSRQIDVGAHDLIEGSPFAAAILGLLGSGNLEWEGTPAKLLQEVKAIAPYGSTLPRSPRGVRAALDRYRNVLKQAGVTIERPARGSERRMVLRRSPETSAGASSD